VALTYLYRALIYRDDVGADGHFRGYVGGGTKEEEEAGSADLRASSSGASCADTPRSDATLPEDEGAPTLPEAGHSLVVQSDTGAAPARAAPSASSKEG